MTLSLGVLAVWLLLSPLAAVVVGVAIARADRTAQLREDLLRRRAAVAVPGSEAPGSEAPAPTPSAEVVQLRLVQRV